MYLKPNAMSTVVELEVREWENVPQVSATSLTST